MKMRHVLLIFLLFGGIYSTQAATYKAITNGNWTDNIWDQPGYPGIDDDVIIDGVMVTIPNNLIAMAKTVMLTNSIGLESPTSLILNSADLIVQ